MATTVQLFRGGIPHFKPRFCCGDFPSYMPLGSMTHFAGTPPFDEHAEAAREQGYLNLSFPFVPNLMDTDAHRWMRTPLQKLGADGDVVNLIWIPRYGFVDSLIMALTQYDSMLDGVYVEPVASRYWWDPETKEYAFKENDLFATELAQYANATKIPLGTHEDGDSSYIFARFGQEGNTLPWSFGHDRYLSDPSGNITGPEDEYCGTPVFGLKFTGDDDKIAQLWRAKFELWINLKYFQHDCPGFTG